MNAKTRAKHIAWQRPGRARTLCSMCRSSGSNAKHRTNSAFVNARACSRNSVKAATRSRQAGAWQMPITPCTRRCSCTKQGWGVGCEVRECGQGQGAITADLKAVPWIPFGRYALHKLKMHHAVLPRQPLQRAAVARVAAGRRDGVQWHVGEGPHDCSVLLEVLAGSCAHGHKCYSHARILHRLRGLHCCKRSGSRRAARPCLAGVATFELCSAAAQRAPLPLRILSQCSGRLCCRSWVPCYSRQCRCWCCFWTRRLASSCAVGLASVRQKAW